MRPPGAARLEGDPHHRCVLNQTAWCLSNAAIAGAAAPAAIGGGVGVAAGGAALAITPVGQAVLAGTAAAVLTKAALPDIKRWRSNRRYRIDSLNHVRFQLTQFRTELAQHRIAGNDELAEHTKLKIKAAKQLIAELS